MPTTSYPSARKSAAVTDESTPPDIATTTRVSCGLVGKSRLFILAAGPARAPSMIGATISGEPPCAMEAREHRRIGHRWLTAKGQYRLRSSPYDDFRRQNKGLGRYRSVE